MLLRKIHVIQLIVGLLLISTGSAWAQIKFTTQVSENTVRVERTFQVQYTIEGGSNVAHFQLPDFPGFVTLQTFDLSSTSLNGLSSKPVRIYQKVVVLSPQKTGKLKIAGASAVVDGKQIQSNAVTVQVVQTGAAGVPSPAAPDDAEVQDQSEILPGENIDDKINDNYFLRAKVNKTTCYVGESLQATYKCYSRLNSSSHVVKRPSLNGFSVVEMVDAYNSRPTIEKEGGRYYYTHVLRQVHLFPLQPGEYELDPAEVEGVVSLVKTGVSGDDASSRRLLNRSLGGRIVTRTPVTRHVNVSSAPVKVHVKPLPEEGKPDHFTGAVGAFTVSAVMDTIEVEAGEVAKLAVIVEGHGNMPLITAPAIHWPGAVKDITDPVVDEAVNKYEYPLAGSKKFEYSFTVKDTGVYTIPGIAFTYFNPDKEVYETATSEPLAFHVIPSHHAAYTTVAGSAESASFLPRYWYYFGIIVFVVIAWIIYQGLQARDEKKQRAAATLREEPVVTNASPVVMPPVDPLEEARQALAKGNRPGFYRSIETALWQKAEAICNIPPSQQNSAFLKTALAEGGYPETVVTELVSILDVCAWALYTPSVDEKDMEVILRRAEAMVKRLG